MSERKRAERYLRYCGFIGAPGLSPSIVGRFRGARNMAGMGLMSADRKRWTLCPYAGL
jgi:hypothetical protein